MSPARVEIRNEQAVYLHRGAGETLVRQLGPLQSFQGAAVVTPSTLFLAHSSEGAEASTLLAIYDMGTKTERVLAELGATGESRFSYNPRNGLVAFNWHDGIHVFSLDRARSIAAARNRNERFTALLVRVRECKDGRCFKAEWRGTAVSYEDQGGHTQLVEVPKALVRAARLR